jgi:hypothetical protein
MIWNTENIPNKFTIALTKKFEFKSRSNVKFVGLGLCCDVLHPKNLIKINKLLFNFFYFKASLSFLFHSPRKNHSFLKFFVEKVEN